MPTPVLSSLFRLISTVSIGGIIRAATGSDLTTIPAGARWCTASAWTLKLDFALAVAALVAFVGDAGRGLETGTPCLLQSVTWEARHGNYRLNYPRRERLEQATPAAGNQAHFK